MIGFVAIKIAAKAKNKRKNNQCVFFHPGGLNIEIEYTK